MIFSRVGGGNNLVIAKFVTSLGKKIPPGFFSVRMVYFMSKPRAASGGGGDKNLLAKF